jgi:hypothetical protein
MNVDTINADTIHKRALEAQSKAYVQNQKKGDLYANIAQYMFWGATTVMAGLVAVAFKFTAIPLFLGALTMPAVAVIAAATFAGSLLFSRRATEIRETGSVLYSTIDSKNQGIHMQRAKALAELKGQSIDEPSQPSGKDWASRVGGPKHPQAASWQERVASEALREDVQTLRQLG